MTVKDLTDMNYEQEMKSLVGRAVLDIYGDYCQPCKAFAPIFEETEKKYGEKIKFYKVNAYNNQEIANRFQIRSIPSIVLLENLKVIRMRTGVMSISELEKFILS